MWCEKAEEAAGIMAALTLGEVWAPGYDRRQHHNTHSQVIRHWACKSALPGQ